VPSLSNCPKHLPAELSKVGDDFRADETRVASDEQFHINQNMFYRSASLNSINIVIQSHGKRPKPLKEQVW